MKQIHIWKAVFAGIIVSLLIFAGCGAAEEKLFPAMPAGDIAGELAGITLTVPGTYTLSGDVTLVKSNLVISGGSESNPVILDLNGHMLTGTDKSSIITVKKNAYFTLKDSAAVQAMYMRNDGGVWKKTTKKQAKRHSEATLSYNGHGLIGGGAGTTVSAKTYGGIVWNEGTFVMDSGTLALSTADFGGAVYNKGGEITILDGNIILTGATEGGAIYQDSGKMWLEGGRIYNNYADKCGAGIYIAGGTLTMFQGASLKDNTAYWRGGGLYGVENSRIELKGGEIVENRADTAGGVYVEKGCKYTNTGCLIENNYDEKGYSEVYSPDKNERLNVEEEDIDKDFAKDKNYAVADPGNANPSFVVQANSSETYYKTLKDAYNAVKSGGTITVLADVEEKMQVTVKKDCRLDLNGKTITFKGSSTDFIYVDDDAKLEIIDKKTGGMIKSDREVSTQHTIYINKGSVSLNAATLCGTDATRDTSDGGAVYIEEGTFTMLSGKICDNAVEDCGGAVYVNDGTFLMYGGEISGNSANYGGAVCLNHKDASFYMYGGRISGNTALYGSDVAVLEGKHFIVGGSISSDAGALWKGY